MNFIFKLLLKVDHLNSPLFYHYFTIEQKAHHTNLDFPFVKVLLNSRLWGIYMECGITLHASEKTNNAFGYPGAR